MGQYYLTVNLDKGEYLDPHKFGDGLKLLEFGDSASGTMTGLATLLADGNGRGGGDLHSENPIIGSWKGDRIVVAGDYADPNNFIPEALKDELFSRMLEGQREREAYKDGTIDEETAIKYAKSNCNLYHLAREFYEDVSEKVIEAMADDEFLKEELENRKHRSYKRLAEGGLKEARRFIRGLEPTDKSEELVEKIEQVMSGLEELEDYEWKNSTMAY